MGKVNLTINDDLEKAFREAAYKVKGMKKGFLRDSIEEALQLWLRYVDVDMNERQRRPASLSSNEPEFPRLPDLPKPKNKLIEQQNQNLVDSTFSEASRR